MKHQRNKNQHTQAASQAIPARTQNIEPLLPLYQRFRGRLGLCRRAQIAVVVHDHPGRQPGRRARRGQLDLERGDGGAPFLLAPRAEVHLRAAGGEVLDGGVPDAVAAARV
jgi:hypothetical protein